MTYKSEQYIIQLEILLATLNDDSISISERGEAARMLGIHGDCSAVEPLITVLKHDPEPSLRLNAIEALVNLGNLRAVRPLILNCNNEFEEVGIKSEKAIIDLYDLIEFELFENERDLPCFLPANNAGHYIGKEYGNEDFLEDYTNGFSTLLCFALESEEVEVRCRAAEALGDLYEFGEFDEFGEFGEYDRFLEFTTQDEFEYLPCFDDLIVALHDINIEVRCKTAEALGKSGRICAEKPLISVLQNDYLEVRYFAADALKKIYRVQKRKIEYEVNKHLEDGEEREDQIVGEDVDYTVYEGIYDLNSDMEDYARSDEEGWFYDD